MRMQLDASEIDNPGESRRVVDNDFFRCSAGREGQRNRSQPAGTLLRRALLIERFALSATDKPLQNNRTISNPGQGARSDGKIVSNQIELGDFGLREIQLVRIRDTDFVPINGKDLAGWFLGHEIRLPPVRSSLTFARGQAFTYV